MSTDDYERMFRQLLAGHTGLLYKVVRANLFPNATPLAKAIHLSHEPRFVMKKPDEKDPAKIEVALAWHITTSNDNRIIWHNGMTGGYASYVAMVPASKFGLVGLSNTASFEVDKISNALLKDLLERK